MGYRHIKDFTIVLAVIMLISFAFHGYYLYVGDFDKYSIESKYKKLSLGEELINKIHDIENSIIDRKQFVFDVNKDPLQQNLIVQTKKDLEKEWREKVESMIRLAATFIENGNRFASIDYKGKTKVYQVGESIAGRKITHIGDGYVDYTYYGKEGTLKLQPIPEKPKEIQNTRTNKDIYVW